MQQQKMTTSLLNYECVEPAVAARASIIWLHGLGANGHDFLPIVPALNLDNIGSRFIFPHAPVQAVTLNGGMAMPAWYDIHGLDRQSHQDEAGILQAIEKIGALIESEHQSGIPYHNIALVGFSQGGALALATGLTYEHRLAGIAALSAYLPIAKTLLAKRSTANEQTSIFMAHGDNDPVVSYEMGNQSKTYLTQYDYPVTWQTYPMAHEVCPQEITDIGQWLKQQLS